MAAEIPAFAAPADELSDEEPEVFSATDFKHFVEAFKEAPKLREALGHG